jgi:hypothetical protein
MQLRYVYGCRLDSTGPHSEINCSGTFCAENLRSSSAKTVDLLESLTLLSLFEEVFKVRKTEIAYRLCSFKLASFDKC